MGSGQVNEQIERKFTLFEQRDPITQRDCFLNIM